MKIRINNCSNNNLRREMRSVAEFVMNHFFRGSKLLKNVDINIVIDNLETRRHQAWGLCTWKGNRYRPRKFLIELYEHIPKKTLLQILIHELVHVKQYLTGEMKDYVGGDSSKWKNTVYYGLNNIDNEYDHYSLPWEHQAKKLSEKLYTMYISSSK